MMLSIDSLKIGSMDEACFVFCFFSTYVYTWFNHMIADFFESGSDLSLWYSLPHLIVNSALRLFMPSQIIRKWLCSVSCAIIILDNITGPSYSLAILHIISHIALALSGLLQFYVWLPWLVVFFV
jgi:hypothetical protein